MDTLPEPSQPHYSKLAREQEAPPIGGLMTRALANPDLLSLGAGFTDNSTLPVDLVRTVTEELLTSPEAPVYLQYGTNQGRLGLRQAVCQQLAQEPGETARPSAETVFITNGSQQALYLAMQSLCDPGDIVLVEEPTYFVFLTILQGLQIEAVGIPTHPDGSPDVEGFSGLIDSMRRDGRIARLKALYLVGYFSNPTSRSLSLSDKTELSRVIEQHLPGVAVIEDAAYRDLYFEAPHPVPSILSLPALANHPCLYLGTFTKPFATGLKVGYGICNQSEWRLKMLWAKGYQDFGTSHLAQAIIEKVIVDGHYPAHLKKLREGYRLKAEAMQAALEHYKLSDLGMKWQRPGGGLYFWVSGPDDLETCAGLPFCEDCLSAGILYVPGSLCYPGNGPRNRMRLSFGSLPVPDISRAVERLAGVFRKFAAAALTGS